MIFASREEAGSQLGQRLAGQGIQSDVILGLPRGGVIVAAEVARVLEQPLSVLVVRKIGHPRHREYAVGAMAEGDVVLLDRGAIAETHVLQSELDEIIEEESARLRSYKERFHQEGEQPLAGKCVIIVDDGLATGATAEAAILSAKKQMARQVILAVPVASPEALKRLSAVADEVIALIVEPDFVAVGQFYQSFPQTTDEEVQLLLHPAHA
jgi:putative phosphoribosyl transferase